MDYIGAALSLLGMYYLPTRYKWAIALFIIGNPSTVLRTGFVWVAYALPNGIWSIVGLQVVFFALNVRARRMEAR